jgi:pyruvate/2-oxoglutarate dehydrogenase complex dihydrolipoamide acyltransferase (E2) component
MFNKMHKFVIVSIVMLMVLGLGLAACQAPTEIQAPPSQPEQPAAPPSQPEQPAAPPAQPEQPAAPPAQPEQPAAKQLSFEAKTYADKQYGFSIQYPKDYVERPDVVNGTKVAAFGIPGFVPGVTISVRDADAPLTADWIMAANAKEGNSNIKVTSDITPTKLDDGTDAFQYTTSFDDSGYPFLAFATSVDKGGKRIRATVWTIDAVAPYDEALFSEIAHTLSVK